MDILAAVGHYGWAENTVEEYFNIDTTKVYVEMKYIRNGGSVCCGYAPAYYDWDDGVPGWAKVNEAYNWYPTRLSQVYIYRRTHFSSPAPPQPSYSLSARFRANPTPNYGGTCSVSNGSIPMGWDQFCEGGIYF